VNKLITLTPQQKNSTKETYNQQRRWLPKWWWALL